MRLLVCAAFVAVVSNLSLPAGVAHADVPTADVNARTRTDAAAKFTQGEQAFGRGEYARAGELFEEAHDAVPHYDSAWNAAQAFLRTNDAARAATWLAVYLNEAPADASDRAEAKSKHDELAPGLARVDVKTKDVGGGPIDLVTLDGRPVKNGWTYAAPGAHRIEGRSKGRVVAGDRLELAARNAITVTLVGPAPPPPKIEPKPIAESSGWSPIVVVFGGAVTAGLGATTIVFGAATQRAHQDYRANPSSSAFDDGESKQNLTNGFFWGTVAAGAVTAAIAIFFVDWKKPVFSF